MTSTPVHMTPRADAIVVLGARVLAGGLPGGSLRARVERGVELWRAGAAPLLVLTGGLGPHPPAEAEVMRRLCRELGVPDEALLLEAQSRSTWDNARFTAALLRARGLGRVLLVTDAFHLYRARQHFWLQGVDAEPVAAPLEGRDVTLGERVAWRVRETFAVLYRPRLLFARRPESRR